MSFLVLFLISIALGGPVDGCDPLGVMKPFAGIDLEKDDLELLWTRRRANGRRAREKEKKKIVG